MTLSTNLGAGGIEVRYEIRLLGPWELRAGETTVAVPGVRLRVMLTSLGLSAGQTVGVDTLIEQLWPEQPPQQPRRSVHLYVGRLRRLLGPGIIRTQPSIGYQLDLPREAVDIHRFRDMLDRVALAKPGDEELLLLRAALGLWRGEPFADLYSAWLDQEVKPRLVEQWLAATGRRIELDLASGQPEPLIAELRDLIHGHPTHEQFWRQQIIALHRAGRRSEALDTYQQARTFLREELGIEPGQALVTVQREILLEGSEPKNVPAVQVVRQLPHDIPRFTGREEELATLGRLQASSAAAPTIISIDGAPGVGKTTLAVHWAHQLAKSYPGGQLYLNLRGYGQTQPLLPEAAAETLLRALGVQSARIPSGLDERSALLRSTLSDRKAMLVLDNARDTEQVRPLLPGGTGLVVVTSRNQLRSLSIRDGATRLTLKPMPARHSVELLASTLGDGWIDAEPAAAGALAELCGRLPLALAVVAERAHRAGSLAQVVAELEDQQARLGTLDAWEDAPDSGLRAALSWSYRALRPEAATMFRMLGLHPGTDIDVRAAAALAGVPVPLTRKLLEQLVSANLVEQRRPDRYEPHDLIRLYAAELAAPGDPDAVRRVLDWYLHATTSGDIALLPHRDRTFVGPYELTQPPLDLCSVAAATTWFEQEFDCLRAVVAWATRHGFTGHAWRIACSMTTFLHRAIPVDDCNEILTSVLAAADAAGDAMGVAYLHYNLGRIQFDLANFDSVQAHNEQALVCFQALAHRPGETISMGILAMVHGQLGNADATHRYATEALRRCEAAGNVRGVAFNLDNLGQAHRAAGDLERAVDCYQRAIATLRDAQDSEVEGLSWYHLGQVHSQLRDFPKAVRAFRRAIAINPTAGNSRWGAILLAGLAATLADAGHPAIARSIWYTALATLAELNDRRVPEIRAALGHAETARE